MNRFIAIVIGCVMIVQVGYAQFLPQTEDIPLMDGIRLEEADFFSFDTPSGQILNFDAKTDLKAVKIQEFYQKAMVAMGWQMKQKNVYRRGKDTFKITFPKAGQVHFDITLSNGAN